MAYFLYFVALLALSQSAIIIRLSGVHAPEVIGFWRLTIVCTLLGIFGVLNLLRQPKPLATLRDVRGSLRGHMTSTLLSGVAFGIHLWTYFLAAANTSVSHCVVLFASNPIFVSAGAWLFYRESLSAKLLFSYLICLVGLVILATHATLGTVIATPFGDAMAIAAAVSFAAFALLGKAPRLAIGNWVYTGLVNAVGALVFLSGAVYSWLQTDQQRPMLEMGDRAWIAVFAMALFPSLMGHGLFMYCLRYMNLNLMSCGKLLEPAIAIVVGFLVFDEGVDLTTLGSFALIAAGVLNLFWPFQIKLNKK